MTVIVLNVDAQIGRCQLSMRIEGPPDGSSDSQTEAINPLDSNVKYIEEYTPGRLTVAKIVGVKQTQANVALAENLQGRIDMSQVIDSLSSENELPLKRLAKGSILQVRILGFHDAKTHRYLPLTHSKSNRQTTLELSCKPSHISKDPLPLETIDDIQEGQKYVAYINKFIGEFLWLNISPTIRGRMHILDLTDKVEKLQNLMANYPVGSAVFVTVLGRTEDGKYLNFSARKTVLRKIDDVSVGSILPGRIDRVFDSGLRVQLAEHIYGRVGLTDISDVYSAKITEAYHENAIVRVCVLEVDSAKKRVALSMRASRTLSSSAKQTDREILSIPEIRVGDVLRGFVVDVVDPGLFVSLARHITGRVLIRDLSDQFLKDWKNHFKVNQLVKAKVLSVDAAANKVGLSLKVSVVEGKANEKGFDQITVGVRVSGVVSRVEDFGLFIKLDGFNLSGLCHKSEVCPGNTSLIDRSQIRRR